MNTDTDTNTDSGLDVAQSFALRVETQSIHSLLRDGYHDLISIRHIAASPDSVFVLTSIGVEKTMKVVMSLCHLRDHHTWPSKHEMRAWGHNLAAMNDRMEVTLAENVANSAHEAEARALLVRHQRDEYWPPLVAALDSYGRSGRFYVLDHLADRVDQGWEAPIEAWNRLEHAILNDHPNLVAILVSPLEAEAGRRELSEYVALSLLQWWEMIHRFCIDGCFGERGALLGLQLAPPEVPVEEIS